MNSSMPKMWKPGWNEPILWKTKTNQSIQRKITLIDLISIKGIEAIIEKLLKKEIPGTDDFAGKIFQAFKE